MLDIAGTEVITDVIVTEVKVRRELRELIVLINLNLKSNMRS